MNEKGIGCLGFILILAAIGLVQSVIDGGDPGTTTTSSKPDCGTPLPQPDGSTYYQDVPGTPKVMGNLSCRRLLRLAHITRGKKGPGRIGALGKAGWTWLDVEKPEWVQPSFAQDVSLSGVSVFGGHGAQVEINLP
jgi:hypothetical protein